MVQEFFDVFPFLRNAMIAGMLAGLVAPLIGAHFLLRRIVFLGIAIPQLASAGIACALLVQGLGWFGLTAGMEAGPVVPMAGALLFTIGGIVVLGALVNRRPEFADIQVGFVFAAAGALSILLLAPNPVGEAHMLNLLKGESIATSNRDAAGAVLFGMLIVGGFALFQRDFLLLSLDRDFAVTLRKPAARHDLLFYVLAGCGVSLCVLTVGPVTTFGHLVLAPMLALLVTRGMKLFFLAASLAGVTAAGVGLVAGYFLDLPVGPTTVVLLAAAYVIVWTIKTVWRATQSRSSDMP